MPPNGNPGDSGTGSRRGQHRRPAKRGRGWLLAGVATVLVLAGVATALALAGRHTPKPESAVPRRQAPATTAPAATTTTAAAPAGPVCPLTGAPPPGGGAVPQRPAIAVKVDNYPTARPQTGLNKADIVFEEPVEGGITRYVAVFQCQQASLVGPVRSARNIDIGILGQLGHPLLVHVGGIQPVLANIAASPLINVDLGTHGSIITNVPGRYAPYDTYTTTADVWGLFPSNTTAPQPLFSYSDTVPSGTPVGSVSIPFSTYSEVVWQYNSPQHLFERTYSGTPDISSNHVQHSAANVVVQFVQITLGPWYENSTGGLEVQANLYKNASGPALIFRNGVEVQGNWSRSALGQPTRFTTTSGTPISLQPGRTWVELVPNTIKVTTTPPTGATTGSAASGTAAPSS